VDREVAFTDTNGEFFVRVKRQREYPVRVLLDQFLMPGYFAVITSPATAAARSEEEAVPFTIVLRRVKPPARPTHTASAPDSPTAVPLADVQADPTLAAPRVGAEPPPVPATQRTASPDYVVQVAALGSAEGAEDLAAQLRAKRYPVIVVGNSSGGALYRVQVGPFRSKREAQAMQARLSRDGFQSLLRPSANPGGLAALPSAPTAGL
jgi:cell division protein FtsN